MTTGTTGNITTVSGEGEEDWMIRSTSTNNTQQTCAVKDQNESKLHLKNTSLK